MADTCPVITVIATFRVTDPSILLAFTRDRYASSWGDRGWHPADLADVVREAVINSNMNPDNSMIGLEIVDYAEAQIDGPRVDVSDLMKKEAADGADDPAADQQ